jgi:hypothetical protein
VRPPSSLCRLCFRRPPDFRSRTAGRDVRIAALNKFEPGCRYCRWPKGTDPLEVATQIAWLQLRRSVAAHPIFE